MRVAPNVEGGRGRKVDEKPGTLPSYWAQPGHYMESRMMMEFRVTAHLSCCVSVQPRSDGEEIGISNVR
jgi:hypothetical protein